MRITILVLSFIMFVANGCSNATEGKDNVKPIKADTIVEIKKTMNNPALIYGSSFGNYFQILYKQGQFDEMLKLTSKTIKERYTTEQILDAYKSMDFGFKIKLKSIINKDSTNFTLNYDASEYATNKVFRLDVSLEDDTIRFLSAPIFKIE